MRDRTAPSIQVKPLGQSGFRLRFGSQNVYIDPYLSDGVSEHEGKDLRRLIPIPVAPERVTDADFVFVTHAHRDHCDPATLLPLADASPACRFVCPREVGLSLVEWGVQSGRVITAGHEWTQLSEQLRAIAVPAAHTRIEADADGWPRFVGYVFDFAGRRIYHAGDTSPHEDIFRALERLRPIDTAFLPVNERNFFRFRRGIIGNMSLREAFGMATEIGVDTLVPMHWDMFGPNSVFLEEIELLYEKIRPPFRLSINPREL